MRRTGGGSTGYPGSERNGYTLVINNGFVQGGFHPLGLPCVVDPSHCPSNSCPSHCPSNSCPSHCPSNSCPSHFPLNSCPSHCPSNSCPSHC